MLVVWNIDMHCRKVGPSPGAPGTSKIPETPRTSSTSGFHGPTRPPQPLEPQNPWDLRTLGKLPLPFEIQDLNAVQLFLICCKKYCDEFLIGIVQLFF